MLESEYSGWITVKKGLQHVALVAVAAAAVAVGNFLMDPVATAAVLPPKYLFVVPILSAAGASLINWAKHRGD